MSVSSLISKRASKLAESPTLRLLAKVRELQARGQRVLEFHIGEPDSGIPPNVARAIKDALDRGETGYTHQAGLPELREAISQYYASQFGLKYQADNIVVTSGPKDTIFKLFATIVDRGDKVIVSDPHWEAYGEQVDFFDGSCIFVPRDKEDLSYRMDYLEEAFKQKPKAIVLTDPDNPTGYKANTHEIEAIAELAKRHDALILSDEIYCLHCYDTEFKSIAHYYPEGTIILSGASKPWAGTGLRLGFALFPENLSHVAVHLAKVTGQASSSVNTPTQYGIIEALRNPETRTWEKQMIDSFREKRDLVEQTIGSLLGYHLGGAFYAAPKAPLHAEEFSERFLAEEHVSVLPLSELSSGEHGDFDNRVRISYGTDTNTLQEGLARFKRFTESLLG